MSRVLVIDDNPLDRLLLKTILLKAGVTTVQEAENGRVGAAKTKTAVQVKQPFDVVFIDLMMPVMDGISAVQQLRSDPETRGAVVIMLTGASERENVDAAIAAGVNDFIVKPLKEAVVVLKLSQYISTFKV